MSYLRENPVKPKQSIPVMTPELQALLDALPPDQPLSRLEPFRLFILRWRREGRSYRRIQQILADECHVHVSNQAVCKFVKRRNRPRQRETEPQEPEPVITVQQPYVQAAAAGSDPWAAARERIRQHKAGAPVSEPKKLFEFTEEDAMRPYVFKKEEK